MTVIKKCTKCHSEKPLSDFHKHPKGKYGVISVCKKCKSEIDREYHKRNPSKRADNSRKWALTNKDKILEIHRKRKYGMTPDDYNTMLDKQNGGCAICGNRCLTFKALSVDHDHETGTVRGLLCNACNISLGKMKDSPALLRKAADYLEKHT